MDEQATPRWVVPAVLLAICVIGALVRIALLDQPMRYDEAVTYRLYVRPATGPMDILHDYSANNHLLHTLLVYASVKLFGNVEWAIRLPALLAGIAIVPAAYVVVRNSAGAIAGLLAAALVASSPALVFYSANARGYTMVALLTLIAFAFAQSARTERSWWSWLGLTIAVALGFWTIPVMAFPAAAVFAWLAMEGAIGGTPAGRRSFFGRLIVCIVATAALTLVLHAPTLLSNEMLELTGNRWVKSLGWERFVHDLRAMPREIARSWTPDMRWPITLPIHLAAIASMFLSARHRSHRVLILPVAIIAAAVVLCFVMRVPPARVWLWLLPLYLGAAAMAITAAAKRVLDARHGGVAIGVVAIVFSAAGGAWLAFGDSLRNSRDTGLLQRANIVASTLRPHLQPTDRIVVSVPANEPLRYYLQRRGFDHDVCQTIAPRRVFIIWTSDDISRGIESPTEMLIEYGVDPKKFRPPEVVREFTRTKIYAARRWARAATQPSGTQPSD